LLGELAQQQQQLSAKIDDSGRDVRHLVVGCVTDARAFVVGKRFLLSVRPTAPHGTATGATCEVVGGGWRTDGRTDGDGVGIMERDSDDDDRTTVVWHAIDSSATPGRPPH